MLNKTILFFLISGWGMPLVMASPLQNDASVSINVNPTNAEQVQSASQNSRFDTLRKEANVKAAKDAKNQDKSYVSNAPSPNDPNYWKQKNNIKSTAQSNKAEINLYQDQQLLSHQTSALQQVLSQLKDNSTKNSKVNLFTFRASKAKKVSVARHHVTSTSPIVQPGTVWYATMISAADSYVPGPVAAELQEGPFSGCKAIGKFKIAPDGKHLVLTFSTLANATHSYSISAIAMDPHTKISGVTGNINHHILRRFVIPGAASFLNEVTHALMSQNQNIVANPSGIIVSNPSLNQTQLALMGASGAASSLEKATQVQGVLRSPEVHIRAGQGFGFLVLKPIV